MAADDEGRQQPSSSSHHFLVVAYGVQSHVNPGRVLARRLAQLGGPIVATLSVPVGTYRRMFPAAAATTTTTTTTEGEPAHAHAHDGVISYVPHSDGRDDGTVPADAEDMARRRRASAESLSAVVARLAARGNPVTCMVCTLVFPPALDAARELGIPLAVFWIQSAAALAVHYHYFHGGEDDVVALAASHVGEGADEVRVVPGLSRPLRTRDFPSFLVGVSGSGSERAKGLVELFRELFEYMDMDQWRPKVLVNTLDELEASALVEMKRHLVGDVFTVGPMVGSSTEAPQIHLFEHGDVEYMEWLHAHPEKSVLYVSFGSVVKQRKQQMDEILGGLRRCGRPYLLVMRRDGLLLEEEDEDEDERHGGGGLGDESCRSSSQGMGMVVEWCDQLEVLSHPAVGCFVTHCGWNSTLEAMASGVPVVGVPSMFDQPTNMFLVEEEWMVGVRGERDGDGGVLTATELARCIELVMGEGARAKAMRERVEAVRDIAKAAADAGGTAERNLRDFVNTFKANG